MRPIWIFLTLVGMLVLGLLHWRGNRSALEVWDDFSMGTNITVTNSIFVSNSVVENVSVWWATNLDPYIIPGIDFSNVGAWRIAMIRHPDSIPIPITTNMSSATASNLWRRVLAKQAEANEAYASFIERMVGK